MAVRGGSSARKASPDELQNVSRSLGLNLNSAKTEFFEGDAVWENAREIEHSAVDGALIQRNDAQPLEELIDHLLDHPAEASRTSLKFVAKRMREHNNTYRVEDFIAQANRMPHAADALAKLFKVAFRSPILQEWFLDYARSDWASFQWSVGQYARMFPSRRRAQKVIRDFFSEVVADPHSSLPLLAVAANRLAAWDPSEARAVIHAAIASMSHPQSKRVLALAALQAKEPRATVRKWLRQEDKNDVTLRMLLHYNFVPAKSRQISRIDRCRASIHLTRRIPLAGPIRMGCLNSRVVLSEPVPPLIRNASLASIMRDKSSAVPGESCPARISCR